MLKKAVAGVLIGALAVVGVSVGLASGEGASPKRDVTPKRGTKPIASASVNAAAARFSVLRDAGAPASSLGPRAARQAKLVARGRPFSAHPVAERSAYKFYVLELSNGLCSLEMNGSSGGGGCTSDMAAFVKGGLNYTFLGDEGWRLTAFLPDGASALKLTHQDGSTTEIDSERNLATAVFKKLPVTAAWSLPDGATQARSLAEPPPAPTGDREQGDARPASGPQPPPAG